MSKLTDELRKHAEGMDQQYANLMREAALVIEWQSATIGKLETENFSLAAGVCEHRGGDEHGNPLCLKGAVL